MDLMLSEQDKECKNGYPKPPNALLKLNLLLTKINLKGLKTAKLVFSGTTYEGAIAFPANVNVAAAIGLAGIGPKKTKLEIWADPFLKKNTHFVNVSSDSSNFQIQIENFQSDENPGTGKITALSIIACLRRTVSILAIGT